MRIPIERLKEVSKQYDLSHVILFAYHPESNEHHIVTYGKTLEGCSQAAEFGNRLKDALGWPEALHQQPSRVKQLQARIAELETELNLRHGYAAFCKSCALSGETPYSFEDYCQRYLSL